MIDSRDGDKLLFTPGPLTTSRSVKEAMLRDVGSRDEEFIAIIRRARDGILRVAGVSREQGYEAVLLQGSGTFGLESVISSVLDAEAGLCVVVNGAYGERLAAMARAHRIPVTAVECPEDSLPDPARVDAALAGDDTLTHVALVHCETTTGILNPLEAIGDVVRGRGRTFIVDAMSSFGGVPFDLARAGIGFLVSSPNKCLEGVPGFSFVICDRALLLATRGRARTLSLDLLAQWEGFESNGQFRFTPPTHALLAFERALVALDEEGGVPARAARYARNHARLVAGMRALGLAEYLSHERQSHVITSFRCPDHPRFAFDDFYARLAQKGYVIYPGKVSRAACFRIGTIGHLFERDVDRLLEAIRTTLGEMGVGLRSRA